MLRFRQRNRSNAIAAGRNRDGRLGEFVRTPPHLDYKSGNRLARRVQIMVQALLSGSLSHDPSTPGPSLTGIFQGSTQCFLASRPITDPVHPQGQCGLNQCASADSKFLSVVAHAEAKGIPHCGQANKRTWAKLLFTIFINPSDTSSYRHSHSCILRAIGPVAYLRCLGPGNGIVVGSSTHKGAVSRSSIVIFTRLRRRGFGIEKQLGAPF